MLNGEKIKKMMQTILMTRSDEIGCEACFEELNRFVELVLDGKEADEIMPLVRHHIDLCKDCREEYEVLLEALDAAS